MPNYYVAGIPFSSELYHHGIKGQKWGVRRFQNPDGTLTVAGRERYGSNLSSDYSDDNGIIRKLATGDWALGKKAGGERREDRLEKKLSKAISKNANKDKIDRLRVKYEAQKSRNIKRDVYNSSRSTGELLIQKMLLGRSGADAYRVSRERGNNIATAIVPALIEGVTQLPISTLISAKSEEAYIKKSRN